MGGIPMEVVTLTVLGTKTFFASFTVTRIRWLQRFPQNCGETSYLEAGKEVTCLHASCVIPRRSNDVPKLFWWIIKRLFTELLQRREVRTIHCTESKWQ